MCFKKYKLLSENRSSSSYKIFTMQRSDITIALVMQYLNETFASFVENNA